ncbi:guanosine-3',5'-bis(diphosphate) 3'-pyrophosphohydrolase MESH1 isoform X2 [Chelonus insularis]|uniref:guanosine-3',5'-bis(diphosphate) 3'-pyrophosphohydrolase MESH1 isoform X2 n=1 Tax=Chelonus insularis TaxID=460826 RepID=UPI00158E5DB7|nr:guanosine-3',5'-bis(diphosphate) 3'-pyrophosphohydrolase MESH1 isoform X2 [Chelonus insularis]
MASVSVQKSPKTLSKQELLSVIIKSINFAALKHKDQRRHDLEATPYINHPIVVIVAAILHDTVEDTETTIEEIENEFGSEVKQVVLEVTDDKSLPKQERKRLQIEHTPHITYEAKLVKLADKIYNLRDLLRQTPIGWTPQRVDQYFLWAKAVIDGCRGTNEKLEKAFDVIITEKEKTT